MQERLIGLVNVVTPSREAIELQVDEAIQNLNNVIQAEEDSISKDAKQKAAAIFAEHYREPLINLIVSLQNNQDLSNQSITEQVNSFFENAKKEIKSVVSGVIGPAVNEAGALVEDALDSGNEVLQQKTSEALDTMLVRLNCGVMDSNLPTEMPDGSKGRTGGAAAITMNYKEYLSVFIAVSSLKNEDIILKRIGNLVQANVSAKSDGFHITQAYSMLEIKAEADLSTTFFAMPVPVTSGGSVTLGQDKYSIGYHSVLGY